MLLGQGRNEFASSGNFILHNRVLVLDALCFRDETLVFLLVLLNARLPVSWDIEIVVVESGGVIY